MLQRWCVRYSIVILTWCYPLASAVADDALRFNRDIRPILAAHCYVCHGPDEQGRQAGLRLDLKGFPTDSGAAILAAGSLEQSEFWQRIVHVDPEQQMPPAASKKPLSPSQIDSLRRWILAGAPWEDHWAFEPLRRPAIPAIEAHHPLDAFVLQTLRTRQLELSPAARPETLVRRVTLDLTGLPPTPAELDAFLADTHPDRYARLVDRLLASPRYGEQMAATWLDAARYADTSGYQSDGPRDMWRWRDWVIDAYNSGMPFDQFTIEQIAGDLLPAATLSQKLATGFQRNHRGNAEGGIVPEEYAVEYVADRVDTTGTVWLGLTIGCARCHDHKFDPVSQRDYYRFFAYFNNIPEFGRAIKEGNSPPALLSPTPAEQAHLTAMDEQLATLDRTLRDLQPVVAQQQQIWEQQLSPESSARWSIDDGMIFQTLHSVDQQLTAVDAQGKASQLPPAEAPAGAGLAFDGERFLQFGDEARFGYFDKFTLAAWVFPTGSLTGGIISKMSDDSDSDGWALHLQEGKLQVNLVKRWLDDALRVETQTRLQPQKWQHVLITYDGSRTAAGITIAVDGILQPQKVLLDLLNQSMANPEPLRVGSTGTAGRFTGTLADIRIFQRVLRPEERDVLATAATLAELAAIPRERRTPSQANTLREAFLATAASPELQTIYADFRRLQARRTAFMESLPTTMVMQERPQPPVAAVLMRGEYNRPAAQVTPGIPAAFEGTAAPQGTDRLALAQWIASADNPLTARVAVNREWQRFFGVGLVKTSEDFGTQAEPPSHPDLLDWLATEFIRSGWDVKHLQRLIVTSQTYCQTAEVEAERVQLDPENRWLARGPRFRLTAETIRDQALAVSGLLSERLGGPSFYPYLPDGLWSEIASTTKYERSAGADLYRRTMYSYWKRTVSNPTLAAFDAPSREACVVRRSRTNTPLQALTLLNDVTFVEAARALASSILAEPLDSDGARITALFRRVTSRDPTPDEQAVLQRSLAWHRRRFREHESAAQEFLQVGDFRPGVTLNDPVELAAYTALANVLLNLDETVSRE